MIIRQHTLRYWWGMIVPWVYLWGSAILLQAQSEQAENTQQETLVAERHPNLRLLARSYGDSVVLRWGALDHITWKVAGRAGYIVERFAIQRTEKAQWVRLTPKPLVPLSVEEWKARYTASDTLIGAAVQAWHGKAIATSTDPFGSVYETYLQQKNLYGFALLLADIDPRIADGLAVRFVDRTATPGKAYLYRVFSVANEHENPVDTAFVLASVEQGEPVGSIRSLRAAEGEKQVVLQWYRYEHTVPFTGYYMEQSFDGGKTFARYKSIPFVPVVRDDEDAPVHDTIAYTIKLQENYKPVYYRVVGVNAFGETSTNSTTVVAMGRDRTAPKAPLPEPYEIVDDTSIRLRWRSNGATEPDLAGFIVAKSEDVEGPFTQISELLPPTAQSYVDANVRDMPQHYYTISAIDTAGNMRSSVPVLGIFPDSIPPATPIGLTGVIDSNGVVVLTWHANTEPDLKGYRVFFANQDDHEYMQLTTDITADTLFIDTLTLETLSEDIYYKVTALDENFNHSPFTAALKLKKPDIVPPAAPLIVGVSASDEFVFVQWHPSPTRDAALHTLLRRKEGEEQWEELMTTNQKQQTSYEDKTAEKKQLYEYALVATDDDSLRSPLSNIVTSRVYDTGIRTGVEGLTYKLDKENNRIVLTWAYRHSGEYELYVYRSGGDNQLLLYQSVPQQQSSFADSNIASGGRYRYGLKVVTRDGGESAMATTDIIEVK